MYCLLVVQDDVLFHALLHKDSVISLVADKFRTVPRCLEHKKRGTDLALRTEEGHEPCRASASIPLFHDIAAKDEAEFKYSAELALIRSRRTEDISNRVVACVHPREIAAQVHASFLVGWRCGESGTRAACPKTQQVD